MTNKEELENEIAEHIGLFIRIKAILDDEEFWDKTMTDEGWHSSLHRDLTKACDKSKKLNDRLGHYHRMIKTLSDKLEKYETK